MRKPFIQYGKHLGARVLAIYGGSSYARQIKRLESGVHIVVGTPGRVIDLIDKGALDLSEVRYLVLDEADEMLKMGFIDDVETILSRTPEARQTALFSATLSAEIRRLAKKYMHDPETVAIEHKTLTVAQTEQRYYLVDDNSKLAAVARLLEVEDITSALIFVRTKIGAAQLADDLLSRGFAVEALHGDMAQDARETVMSRFRRGQISALVATDVAARGLDIEDMSHVINYDVPYDAEDYVHRIGRTGRAGKTGVAITLVTPRERRWLRTIEDLHRAAHDAGETAHPGGCLCPPRRPLLRTNWKRCSPRPILDVNCRSSTRCSKQATMRLKSPPPPSASRGQAKPSARSKKSASRRNESSASVNAAANGHARSRTAETSRAWCG